MLYNTFKQLNWCSFDLATIAFPGKLLNKEEPEHDNDCFVENILSTIGNDTSDENEFCKALVELFASEEGLARKLFPKSNMFAVHALLFN